MKNNKFSIIVSITMFFLFAFVLITSSLLVNLYAKYHTSNTATDQARVAIFDIDLNVKDGIGNVISESINYNFTPGSSVKLNVNFDGSNNEVMVKYTINVSTYGNLPLTIKAGSSDLLTDPVVGEIAPHSSASTQEIVIDWDEIHNSYLFSGEIDLITVTIIIEQVD